MRETGPLARRIWLAVPMLERVAAGDLDGYGPAEARACDRRRSRPHLCLLCGRPAGAALIARPTRAREVWEAVWVDLCPACFVLVRDEGIGL
jgi:hypothetical protein